MRPGARATALVVQALLVALPACGHDSVAKFDPETWKATSAELGKSRMAHDFEAHWAWRGASRDQLIAWLGPPDRDEFDARWNVGDPCPSTDDHSARSQPLTLEIWWTDHQTGAQVKLHNRCVTSHADFSPEAWAMADTPTRSAMYPSLVKFVKSMHPVEFSRLREIFGDPIDPGDSLTWCVNDGLMDWYMMTVSMAGGRADMIQFWDDK